MFDSGALETAPAHDPAAYPDVSAGATLDASSAPISHSDFMNHDQPSSHSSSVEASMTVGVVRASEYVAESAFTEVGTNLTNHSSEATSGTGESVGLEAGASVNGGATVDNSVVTVGASGQVALVLGDLNVNVLANTTPSQRAIVDHVVT